MILPSSMRARPSEVEAQTEKFVCACDQSEHRCNFHDCNCISQFFCTLQPTRSSKVHLVIRSLSRIIVISLSLHKKMADCILIQISSFAVIVYVCILWTASNALEVWDSAQQHCEKNYKMWMSCTLLPSRVVRSRAIESVNFSFLLHFFFFSDHSLCCTFIICIDTPKSGCIGVGLLSGLVISHV